MRTFSFPGASRADAAAAATRLLADDVCIMGSHPVTPCAAVSAVQRRQEHHHDPSRLGNASVMCAGPVWRASTGRSGGFVPVMPTCGANTRRWSCRPATGKRTLKVSAAGWPGMPPVCRAFTSVSRYGRLVFVAIRIMLMQSKPCMCKLGVIPPVTLQSLTRCHIAVVPWTAATTSACTRSDRQPGQRRPLAAAAGALTPYSAVQDRLHITCAGEPERRAAAAYCRRRGGRRGGQPIALHGLGGTHGAVGARGRSAGEHVLNSWLLRVVVKRYVVARWQSVPIIEQSLID